MSNEMILEPMVAMLVLTAVVWFFMFARRLTAMQRLGKPAQTYATPDTISLLPEEVNYAAYNFKNLFELPVLFYAVCLYLYVTGGVDGAYVTAAWLFVGFRVLHSAIHCTVNIVMARFLIYLGSAFALWYMLGRVALDIAGV